MSDIRPADCRFRLQDEGKPYPRSSCSGCGRTITTGLGNSCQRVNAVQQQSATRIARLERELAEARELLRLHHDHHLETGPIGLPDGQGGWIEIDNGAEYSDSSLYERTEAALTNTPREWKPMPRGGMQTYWWQVGILERRKRKAAEAERDNAQSLADWYHRTSNEATDRIWEVIGRDPTREGGQNLLLRITELVAERDRLAAEVERLKQALTDIDRRYRNGANADTLVRIARLAAAKLPGGQI